MKLRIIAAAVALVVLAACGGSSASDSKSGDHDHGGPDAFNSALVSQDVIADVTIDPARAGAVTVHMEFSPPGGGLQKVQSVSGTLTSSDGSQPSLSLEFEESGANHFHEEIEVPSPGEWTLEFEALLADGGSARYSTTVDIKP